MKKLLFVPFFTLLAFISTATYSETVLNAPNGIKYPTGLENWRVLGTSYRTDNNTQRVILGNSTAIKASRSGKTNPWPEGSILAKLVWKNVKHPNWEEAIAPGNFIHSEIMVKNSSHYKTTGGWGYARWIGASQEPYGNDEAFSQECFSCHSKVKNKDYVFTIPAQTP
jgi:hypothetical protein